MKITDIAFFDVETTGLDPLNDRIIEIAVHRRRFVEEVNAFRDTSLSWYVNPGRPIPPSITELTKITDKMVETASTFPQIAPIVADMLCAPVIVGFNCHLFDVPVLAEEFARAGVDFAWPTVIDVGTLFKIYESRDLSAALRFYCRKEHTGAHGAVADVDATMDVFYAQLRRYVDMHDATAEEISLKSRYGKEMVDPAGKLSLIDGKVCFATKRNQNMPVADDIGYAHWMLRSDFAASTKQAISKELARIENAARPLKVLGHLESDEQGDIGT